MITKKTWKEFRESGLLWMINTTLHMFGWAICLEVEDDGSVSDAYPARVKFRGFDEGSNTLGYQRVTGYMRENIDEIYYETLD